MAVILFLFMRKAEEEGDRGCDGWMVLLIQWTCAVCLVAQSCQLFATPWTVARQAPLSMGIL